MSAPATTPPRRRTPAAWLADQSRLELALWAALIALALVLRLWDLGARPFHHDESQDAYFSWLFSRDLGGGYAYDPLLHGPFRFFLTAAVYKVFGDSDFTARLAPAAMGMAVVILPFFLRRQLGRIAAFTAAVLFAVGPSYLYYSRFAREDIYFAALSLALIVVVWRYLERPTRWGPSAILGLVALMFACKETAFISMAVAGVFFIPAAFVARSGVWAAMARHGWRPWLYGLITFLLLWGLFFGVFFTQWGFGTPRQFAVVCADGTQSTVPLYSGFLGGFLDGIDYWLAQQCVARGGEQAWLYPALLLGDEWPTLLLGLAGAVWVLLRPTTMRVFLLVAFVGQLALYMYAAERFAWLVLHPLLPLVLLAALGVQALWRASRARVARLALGVALAAGLAGTAYGSFQANARLGADPRELLVTTQSDVAVKRVADELVRLAPGRRIEIDSTDMTFPFAWYLRDLPVSYPDMRAEGYQPTGDLLVTSEQVQPTLLDRLGDYDGRQFQFRVWWVRDWSGARSLGNWLAYVFDRRPWNPTGGLKAWLYVKR